MERNKNFERLLQYAAEAYVNEEIEQYKKADVSDIVISEKLVRKVNRMIQTTTTGAVSLRIFAKAACIILAVCIAVFAISMSIPTVRSLFFQFVEEHFNYDIGITYYSDDTGSDAAIDAAVIPHIPEYWSINILIDTPVRFSCEILGDAGEFIVYTQNVKQSEDASFYIDNDPASTEIIALSDIFATLYTYSDGTQILLWLDRYTFTMIAEHTSRETLLSLAASVSAQ